MFKKNEAIELDKATYRVIEFIHRGNQAQVWQVASEDGERRFALKVVCPFEAKSGRHTPRDQRAIHDLVQRAEMEIAFLRDLPNAQAHHILPCLDSGTVIWQNVRLPALLAPLMHEELSLYCPNLSHKPKPFSLEKALTWFRQIAQALAYVHGLNSETHLYIHSNIKPSNILLDAAGNAFLTDFGILKAARHTGTTSVACNHDYCAPEQRLPQFLLDRQGKLENQYYLTPATDLYALGAVVYSLFGGGTAAQDRLAEESTVNTHLRTLEERVTSPNPASPVGLLGQIGGLTKTEAGKLRRVLMDLQSHNRLSAGSSVIDPELDAGLPNPAWIADRIVELVEKLLAAWPNHRPTASTVLTSVIDLQAALSPCLQRIAFRGETHFQSDQEIVLHLDFAGEGLAPDLNWIKVEFQGKILENLHPELIGQAKDTGVLAANIVHTARLTLAACALAACAEEGDYPVLIIAQVGEQTRRAVCEIEFFYTALQLWQLGEHENALKKELRVAWLEKLYKSLASTTAAYHHLQLLERLKAHHPEQKKLLDSFKERIERGWQGPASNLRSKGRLLLKNIDRTTATYHHLQMLERLKAHHPEQKKLLDSFKKRVERGWQDPASNRRSKGKLLKQGSRIGLASLALFVLTLASAYLINNLPPPAPSPEVDLREARALLEGNDETQWPGAIKRLTILAKTGNAEAMRLLGAGYYLGLGVDEDHKRGCSWYKQSAEAGNQEAKEFYEKFEKCR